MPTAGPLMMRAGASAPARASRLLSKLRLTGIGRPERPGSAKRASRILRRVGRGAGAFWRGEAAKVGQL
jgi:hypothetical protein